MLFTCEKSKKIVRNSGLGRNKLAYAILLVIFPLNLDNEVKKCYLKNEVKKRGDNWK